MRVYQQDAFILINRPYSESSWIVEVFTRDYGRLALMAKGARRIKSKLKGVLLPFQPVLISWSGKGEIPTLTAAEIRLTSYNLIDNELQGDALVCGFYCNELVANLLHRYDPHSKLFDQYSSALMNLSKCSDSEELGLVLRDFECSIVKETGYGISFTMQANGKSEIELDGYYRFIEGKGFEDCLEENERAISGKVIRSLAGKDKYNLSLKENSQSKHLMREILHSNLGYRKVLSRELFFPRER